MSAVQPGLKMDGFWVRYDELSAGIKSMETETKICMTGVLPLTAIALHSFWSYATACRHNPWCQQTNLGQKWMNIEWDMMSWVRALNPWKLRQNFSWPVSRYWLPLLYTYSSPTLQLMVGCRYNPWCQQSNLDWKWTNTEWDMMSWAREVNSWVLS
jgi:hypothetical protein